MWYYEINIVAEKLVDGYFYVDHSFGVYPSIINKDEIDDLWNFISKNALMAAKQKISITSCVICNNGEPGIPEMPPTAKKVKTLFESYCLMFKPKHKFMQLTLTTARNRKITVCITRRKGKQ